MLIRRIYERYLARQIYLAFLLILLAFVGLFTFFDLLTELGDVGKAGYSTWIAVAHVLLLAPSRFYEIIPIAALIGTIYVFAQLATHSEFTILRVAGLYKRQALGTLIKIGLPIVLCTYIVGEFISPAAEQMSETIRLQALGSTVSSGLRTGVWVKDRQAADMEQGAVTRFVNVGTLQADQSITDVSIYEFDEQFRLKVIRHAQRGVFEAPNLWVLSQVKETHFHELSPSQPLPNTPDGLQPRHSADLTHVDELRMRSELTPQILSVLLVTPGSMSILDLFSYIHHLKENRQDTQPYQIALWKKLIYPLTVLVMMALALPFAYLHGRSGSIGIKVFGGIMLGMSFQLLNTLFSHVGLLNVWPAYLTAILPGGLYLLLAGMALHWVERH